MRPTTVTSISAPLQPKPPVSNASKNIDRKQELKARVCVFCGSSAGTSPAHLSAARSLAATLHKYDMDLVYGGGTVGLMGELARTLVSLRGKEAVKGVIPGGVINAERPEHQKGENQASGKASKRPGERKKEGWWARKRVFGSGKAPRPSALSKAESQQIETKINEKFGLVTITPSLAARKECMVKAVVTAGSGGGFVALSGGFGTMDEVMEVVALHHHGVHKRRVVFFNVEGFYDDIGQWVKKAIEAGFVRPETMNVVAVRDSAEGVVEWLRDGT